MKILVTGATASQLPSKKVDKPPTFSSLLVHALTVGGHEVVWSDPSLTFSKDYLSEFDSVVVGVSPPTSTAAHKIYGTLAVIDRSWDLNNLTLLVDAPEPKRVWAGIRAIYNKPGDLTKDFYSKRKEYKEAINEKNLSNLHSAITRLYTQGWPTTLFPVFPWMSHASVSSEILGASAEKIVGLNFDSYIIQKSLRRRVSEQTAPYWTADSASTKWVREVEKTLKNPVISTKRSKWERNNSVLLRVAGSIGCLVSVYKFNNPWWSSALAQGLSQGVPVATDWRLTSMLGSEWTHLPYSIEELSEYDRKVLSELQKILYLQAVPSWEKSVELATNALLRK
jgi:hypothetical protein